MQIRYKGCAALLALSWTISQASAAACIQTTYNWDGNAPPLTAALVNPTGNVSGDIDATGCDIGVYYGPGANGQVNAASIHGSIWFGVVNNGANVNIQNSSIYDIGDSPLDGVQYGIGVYFSYGSAAKGNIQGNTFWNYQKGAIVVDGNLAQSNIQNNTVIGQGPVNFIAQNGIQLGYGAQGNIQGNLVVGNSYTGTYPASSGGIIILGGDCYGTPTASNINIQQNIAVGNDVGVWLSNVASDCIHAVSTPTKNQVQNNTIRDNAVNNTSGEVNPITYAVIGAYQAGVSDQGDGDTIQNNSICGVGYTPVATPPPFLYNIDVTVTNNATVKSNTTCNAASDETDFSARTIVPTVHPAIHPQIVK